MKKHLDPQVFRPSVLNQRYELNAPLVQSEGRILSDTTMPLRNWSGYDVPTFKRKFMAPRFRAKHAAGELPLFLVRQAG